MKRVAEELLRQIVLAERVFEGQVKLVFLRQKLEITVVRKGGTWKPASPEDIDLNVFLHLTDEFHASAGGAAVAGNDVSFFSAAFEVTPLLSHDLFLPLPVAAGVGRNHLRIALVCHSPVEHAVEHWGGVPQGGDGGFLAIQHPDLTGRLSGRVRPPLEVNIGHVKEHSVRATTVCDHNTSRFRAIVEKKHVAPIGAQEVSCSVIDRLPASTSEHIDV